MIVRTGDQEVHGYFLVVDHQVLHGLFPVHLDGADV